MTADLWTVLVVVLAPIVAVGGYFWRAERRERARLRRAYRPTVGEILVNGSCSPARLVLPSEEPLRLLITRTDDGEPWWDDFEFPYRRVKRELPEGETVVVDLQPLGPGEYAYFCAQGTKRGTLVVEPGRN